jgi:DNA invertase Pin-like site-specific DNA recombinase
MTEGTTVVGYIRVSTDKQGERGEGSKAQETAIRTECERRGWRLLRIERDVVSGKSLRGRQGLELALAACRTREADGIVVAKLDRLSRSVVDAGKLLIEAQSDGWNIVALDLGIDLSTSHGKLVANILIAVAEWEREQIGERTSSALAEVKKRTARDLAALSVERGVEVKPIGRPPSLPAAVRKRVRNLRSRGWSYARIADKLNEEGVATAQGGLRWYPATVRHVAGNAA